MKKKNFRSSSYLSQTAPTDTGDRRAATSGTPRAVYARARYYRLKAAGLCARCGRTRVLGRTVCFACIDGLSR